MTTIKLDLVYRDGAFRLRTPLAIPEETEASAFVNLPSSDDIPMTSDEVHEFLVQSGLALPKEPGLTPPLSEEERAGIAALMGGGKPASEMIHEDREEQF